MSINGQALREQNEPARVIGELRAEIARLTRDLAAMIEAEGRDHRVIADLRSEVVDLEGKRTCDHRRRLKAEATLREVHEAVLAARSGNSMVHWLNIADALLVEALGADE